MNAIQAKDLDRILEDCRTGQNQPVCDASMLENSLRQRMEAMFAERLPRLDFVAIAKASHLAEDGLAKARRGALDEAQNAFRAAQAEAASFPFFAAGRRIVSARLAAAEAYLDFRLKRYTDAEQRLRQALQWEDALENDFGYVYYHIHRVHLIENLTRVYWLCTKPEIAASLTGVLLGYLNSSQAKPGVDGRWNRANLESLDRQVLRQKFTQIFSLFALSQHRLPPPAAASAMHALLEICGEEPARWIQPRCATWIAMRSSWLRGDHSGFLAGASRILRQGPAEAPILWYLAAADVVALSKSSGITGHPFQEYVAQDLAPRVSSPALKSAIAASVQ